MDFQIALILTTLAPTIVRNSVWFLQSFDLSLIHSIFAPCIFLFAGAPFQYCIEKFFCSHIMLPNFGALEHRNHVLNNGTIPIVNALGNVSFKIIRIIFASGFSIHRLEHEVFKGVIMFYVTEVAFVLFVSLYLVTVICWNRYPVLHFRIVKLRRFVSILYLPEPTCQILPRFPLRCERKSNIARGVNVIIIERIIPIAGVQVNVFPVVGMIIRGWIVWIVIHEIHRSNCVRRAHYERHQGNNADGKVWHPYIHDIPTPFLSPSLCFNAFPHSIDYYGAVFSMATIADSLVGHISSISSSSSFVNSKNLSYYKELSFYAMIIRHIFLLSFPQKSFSRRTSSKRSPRRWALLLCPNSVQRRTSRKTPT